jgi:S-(hydroxymethyl)glutathione dehydrogenase / alcohol dehydrogenase
MRAAVLRDLADRIRVEEVTVSAPRPNEVLVDTVAAGVCGSDVHVVDGRMGTNLPVVLGHEAAGVVAEVGSDVRAVKPGDPVVVCQSSFCGGCECCLKGLPSLCRTPGLRTRADGEPRVTAGGAALNLGSGIGAFAEQMLLHERSVVAIPAEVPLESAAMLGCAVTTGMGAVLRTAAVPAGATVAVVGAGAIGLSCVQGARLAGASRIIVVDRNADRLKTALSFGATETVVAHHGLDTAAAVMDLCQGGVEYSFEAVGTAATVADAFGTLRYGGVCTVIGIVPKSTPISLSGLELLAERRIQGSALGSNRFHLDVPRYLDLYHQGRLKLDEMVGASVGLDDIGTGIDSARATTYTRTIVHFRQH